MEAIIEIINSIDSNQRNVNPTEVYNEGWMTRILVYYSIKEQIKLKGIDFGTIDNWTSEALISSPFVYAKNFREGYTHADMALGDFDVDYEARGEIKIKDKGLFGIIEAKMGSNLSQGTTHAPNYNQASRNLACIAYNTMKSGCKIFFAVAAPKQKIEEHAIEEKVNLQKMLGEIEKRFDMYDKSDAVRDSYSDVMKKASGCSVWTITYEDWIEAFSNVDIKIVLNDFYEKSLHWNRIRKDIPANR
ncbi:hypothetical protein JYU20_03695 [Bacteroidales bacterium AH-315-I05]|nr:hypothetical protein [Bacteroidales bacterium AH-315-I05]